MTINTCNLDQLCYSWGIKQRENINMNNIKLMSKEDALDIRKSLSKQTIKAGKMVSLPVWVAYQREGSVKVATGRATCRVCGEKIRQGLQVSFYFDEEQNNWTGKQYNVHADDCISIEDA